MWLCRHCGESCGDEFNACWKCQTARDGQPLVSVVAEEAEAVAASGRAADEVPVTVFGDAVAGESMAADEPGDPLLKLVTVLQTRDPGLILAARAALDAEGIEYAERDRDRSLRDQFGVQRAIQQRPSEFMVRPEDEARARALVDGLSPPQTGDAEGT